MTSCLTCGKRLGLYRGCCHSCYTQHAARVRAGKASWQALEESGKALPSRMKETRKRVDREMSRHFHSERHKRERTTRPEPDEKP